VITGAPWTLPSPGSFIVLTFLKMTQPLSVSIEYHSTGYTGISLPGKVFIVETIHSRMFSRPSMLPMACSTYFASSVKWSAYPDQSHVLPTSITAR